MLVELAFGEFVARVVSAPFVEEAMKGLAVLYVFRRRREHLDGVTDGIVYALFVGLGFAVVENIQYYVAAIEEGGADRPSHGRRRAGTAHAVSAPVLHDVHGYRPGPGRQPAWRGTLDCPARRLLRRGVHARAVE